MRRAGHLTAGLALAAALASSPSPALAIPPDGPLPPRPQCPPGERPVAGECVPIPRPPKPPPPPPSVSPQLALDVARQTTDLASIRVRGWAADGDAPQAPLTVTVRVDGGVAATVVADGSRPDVAAAHPSYGPAHGYDLHVPASGGGHTVCVTAGNVGSGGDSTTCGTMDEVIGFEANTISYDTAAATLVGTQLDELDKVTNTNQTSVQQSTTITGQRSVTETQGWSDTKGVKVSISTGVKVGIPIFAEGKITVSAEGSYSYTQNSSTAQQRTFSWSQPVLVPARSRVVATVAVTKATLVVPYTLSGSYLYASGHREGGVVTGTYAGVNSHDLEVRLSQFNLDGTPAARPAGQQPAAVSVSPPRAVG